MKWFRWKGYDVGVGRKVYIGATVTQVTIVGTHSYRTECFDFRREFKTEIRRFAKWLRMNEAMLKQRRIA